MQRVARSIWSISLLAILVATAASFASAERAVASDRLIAHQLLPAEVDGTLDGADHGSQGIEAVATVFESLILEERAAPAGDRLSGGAAARYPRSKPLLARASADAATVPMRHLFCVYRL